MVEPYETTYRGAGCRVMGRRSNPGELAPTAREQRLRQLNVEFYVPPGDCVPKGGKE